MGQKDKVANRYSSDGPAVIELMYVDSGKNITENQTSSLCGSQRLLIAFLLGFCAFSFYAQRQSFNMGILCMVDHKTLSNMTSVHHNHTSACRVSISSPITDEEDDDIINGPYVWEKNVQSLLLGSFFWGYCFQLFGGVLSGLFGPKKVLTLAVFVSSATTLLIPFGAKIHYTCVACLRLLCGISQGFMYPCCLPLISKWSPIEERGKLTSFLAAGSSLGIILATAITGPICKSGHWYINYIALGSIGFIWLIFWLYFGADRPDESRCISKAELIYIQERIEKTSEDDKTKSIRNWPLRKILTSRSILIIMVTNVLSDFTLYGIFSVFPLYLWEVYNLSVVTNSYISAAEYALMWLCCVIAGILSDMFIKKRWLSKLNTRKVFNSIGMIIPAILFPIIGFTSCDDYVIVIVLLILGGGLQGTFINAGYLLNTVDVAGQYSGIAIGISNSFGSFSGILAPLVANVLTKHRTKMEWRTCFLVFSGVLFLAGLIFMFFSKGELEDWAKDKSEFFDSVDESGIKLKRPKLVSNQYKDARLRRQYSFDDETGSLEKVDPNGFKNNIVIVRPGNLNNSVQNVQNF